MQAQVLRLSEMNLQDRLTVGHYVSDNLELIRKLSHGKYPLAPLGNLAIVRGGKRLPPKAQYSEAGVPYVRVVDVGNFEVELDDVVFISPELHKTINRYQLKYNDIAIVIVGATIGKVAIFKSSVSPCNFNENMARLTVKDGSLNPDYLLAYLQNRYGQAYIHWLTGGAAQAKLSLERIKRIQVPVSPRPIQDRIAQVMQDANVAQRQKLAEADCLYQGISEFVLKELGIDTKETQSHGRVFVPVRSIAGGRFDFEAVVSARDVSFDGMEAVLLRDVAQQVNERITPAEDCPNEDVNYIGLGNIASHTGELAEFSPVKGLTVLSSSPKFQRGDILFGRMRPYLNKVWIAGFDGVCSGEAIVLRPDKEKIDTGFLHALLLSLITLQQVVPLQSGTSLPRVSASDILNIKLPVPEDLKRQTELADEIARRRTEANRLRTEAEAVVAKARVCVERMILGEDAA